MTKKEQKQFDDFVELTNKLLDADNDLISRLRKELQGKNRKLFHQRQQLRMFSEKMELMKTWSGIFRTIGQRLGICR